MLSLHGNGLCPDGLSELTLEYNYEEYKFLISSSFPMLRFLDHLEVAKRYKGSDVRRQTEILKFHPLMLLDKIKFRRKKTYQPLPDNTNVAGVHSGKFTYKNYKYLDKNSEGNRFIVNSDL